MVTQNSKMLRLIFRLCLISPVVFLAPAASRPWPAPFTFQGVALGGSETEVFAQISRIAPGAMQGPLCAGNDGISSRLTYLEADWQIMAHMRDGIADEIRLLHYSGGATQAERCKALFETTVAEQKARHPHLQWIAHDTSSEEFAVRHLVEAHQDGLKLSIYAERLNWEKARCAVEILMSQRETSTVPGKH